MSFVERLALARAGDQAVLGELFGRWRPLLLLQARQALGEGLSARVEPADVVQECCTQAFADLAHFRGGSEAEWVAWLRSIVVGQANKARRYHRAEKRDAGRDIALPSSFPASSAPQGHELEEQERYLRLGAAIEALPEALREVVVRRAFHGQPFEAVAQALGRSGGAVRVLWVRALRALSRILDSDDQPRRNSP